MLDGRGVRITFAGRTDTVILMNRVESLTVEGLTLRGTAFVVTTEHGKRTVTTLASGTATPDKETGDGS